MLVITLTNCPPALRGDLSAWLQEIDTGVFVGNVSARVRLALWERVQNHVKSGRALMVFTARNEQGMDFLVHQMPWRPIDFDGLKLMMRPSVSALQTEKSNLPGGFSKAAKMHTARRMRARTPARSALPNDFVVVDLETSGLNPQTSQIIELAALKVLDGKVADRFQSLVHFEGDLPKAVEALTKLSADQLNRDGKPLRDVLSAFLTFAGNSPLVSHNASFDLAFLRTSLAKLGLQPLENPYTDTLELARRLVKDVRDYKLSTLAAHLDIRIETSHRSVSDCETTLQVYSKLIEIQLQSQ